MNVIDAIQAGTKGMDGNKTAQINYLRISSQREEELWGLKSEKGSGSKKVRMMMEVRRRIQANANQNKTLAVISFRLKQTLICSVSTPADDYFGICARYTYEYSALCNGRG